MSSIYKKLTRSGIGNAAFQDYSWVIEGDSFAIDMRYQMVAHIIAG
jgi:hypothetical protein